MKLRQKLKLFYGLTAVCSAVDELISITFCLGDFVAVFWIVEGWVVVAWWWGWWFGAAVGWWNSHGTEGSTSDWTSTAILIVRSSVTAILRSVLFVFGGAIGWVIIFGTWWVYASIACITQFYKDLNLTFRSITKC